MNQRKLGMWARGVVWGMVTATLAIGCNPLNLAAFLFVRDEKEPAQYPLTFAKDSPKKDKDEIVVLLLPHMLTQGSNPDYVTADRDLAEKLSKTLPDLAKENKDKKKVRVITPTQVDKFKMANPHWKHFGADKIGAKLDADFVLEIDLAQVQLYQPNTPVSEKIYEGRAEISVNIYEVDGTGGTLKDHYSFTFTYPRGVGMIRSATALSVGEFKQQYIENLSVEIAQRHVDHKKSNTFSGGK